MNWNMQTSSPVSDKDIQDVIAIFEDGFGQPGWSYEGIKTRFKASTVGGFLEDDSGLRFGYAFYSMPLLLFKGAHILWEDAICVRKSLQGARHASPATVWPAAWNAARDVFPGKTVEWVGGRTQNPLVMHRYWRQTASDSVYPIRRDYQSGEGKELAALLQFSIAELESMPIPSDGILRGRYGKRLGDYAIESDYSGIEDWLLKHNFNRDAGDAVVMISKLDTPIGPKG
jgi:hypothetical protein